jgi:hypothetical protein
VEEECRRERAKKKFVSKKLFLETNQREFRTK